MLPMTVESSAQAMGASGKTNNSTSKMSNYYTFDSMQDSDHDV